MKRGLVVWCAAAVALTVVGCGSNFDAQSQQVYQPAVGISDRDGDVYAINTLIVTDGRGNGTVVSALINQAEGEDTLRSVTATDDHGTELQAQPLPDGGIALPPRQSLQLGSEGLARISSDTLEAGQFVTLTFTFANAQPVEIDAPVVNDGPIYADVPVGGGDSPA
jgi:hypothetical protein